MAILTPDRRYIVVRDRLWRAADPGLPDATREDWQRRLMAARRAIRDARATGDAAAERRARRRVHGAKVALGERGPVWWNDGAPDENRRLIGNTRYREWWEQMLRIRSAILAMVAARRAGTVCPSEVARAVRARGWRSLLPAVREVARELVRERLVTATQAGETLRPNTEWRGPIRLGRPRSR